MKKATLVRSGLLITLLAMSAALLLSAWTSKSDVEAWSSLLDHAEAQGLARPLLDIHHAKRRGANDAELTALLENNRDAGLRYVAEFGFDGQPLAEAGEPIGPRNPGRPVPPGPRQLTRLGSRNRLTLFPPPGVPVPVVVLEIEPMLSKQTRAHATRTFVMSCVAAGLLLAVASGLWLVLLRDERRRERDERERGLAALGEMSAVLAHEIRNPLASLKGHAQLLAEQMPASDPKLVKKVDRIVEEALRIEELSATLLDFVRSSSVERKRTNPATLLREAADALDAKRIDIDVEHAPESWPLDPPRMRQVLQNVLQNALQASPDGARVEASASVDRGALVISVRDHGPGLPTGEEEAIFEAFRSGRAKGTGLGLAIARRIVELHDGTLIGKTLPEGGAEFVVRIPA